MNNNMQRVLDKISPALARENARLIDERFQAQKEREESRFLAKVSRVLIGLWDLSSIIMKSKPGTQIIIDADSGRIYTGRVKLEKLSPLPEKVPGRTSLEMDTHGFHEHFVSRSYVTSFGSPRKNAWNSTVMKAPKHKDSPVVDLFEDKLQEVSMADVSINQVQSSDEYYYEVSIKGYPIILGIQAKVNKVFYYIYNGEKILV